MADRGLSDLLSTASTLMNSSQSHSSNASHGSGHAHKPSSSEQGNVKPSSSSSSTSHTPKPPSHSEILSSAQVVMNAAKNKLHKPSSPSSSATAEDVNMGKLAGAAGTLLGAVSHYGKIEESGYGKYAHKAQEYLHSYEIKHGKPGTVPTAPFSQGSTHHATSAPYGNGQGNSTYAAAPAGSYGQQPSAPNPAASAPYPAASAPYPPAGYPDAQQGYAYGHQGYSKPHASGNIEAPIGYPPAGYPTSGSNYNRPGK